VKRLALRSLAALALLSVPAVAVAPSSTFNLIRAVTANVSGLLTTGQLAVTGTGSTGDVSGMSVGASAALSTILSGASGLGTAAFYGILPTNTAAQNDAAMASALASLGALGGGTINFPCGAYQFNQVDNNVQGVLLKGQAPVGPRDAGTSKFCTRFVANTAGILMRHRTPYGQGLSKYVGGGFENIALDANGLATRLIDVDTVNGGTYIGAVMNAQGREAAWFHSGVSGQDVADAADVQRTRVNLFCRQIDGTAAQTADCFRLDGSANANFSVNEQVRFACATYNGNCLTGVNADNNSISVVNFRVSGGNGQTVYAYGVSSSTSGFRNNFFYHFSGNAPSYVQGTADTGVTGGVKNEISFFDTDNSTPVPMSGIGSAWYGEFQQTYSPTVTCGSGSLTSYSGTPKFIRRAGKQITLSYELVIGNVGSCTGSVNISLPAPVDGVVPSTGSAVERAATGNSYLLLAAPGLTSMRFIPPAGQSVNLQTGWVISTSINYLSAY
jgi:hypothetical protein